MHFAQSPPDGIIIKDIVGQLIDYEIHYGDSDLINSSIDINNINNFNDYYSYNLTIENFDIINVDLYSTEDDTPVYLYIKYSSNIDFEDEHCPGDIDLFIILNDNYTFKKSNEYYGLCLNPLDGADGYYNETSSEDEIMVTGQAYFSYQDLSFFITANYIKIEDFMPHGDIKNIVLQLVS